MKRIATIAVAMLFALAVWAPIAAADGNCCNPIRNNAPFGYYPQPSSDPPSD